MVRFHGWGGAVATTIALALASSWNLVDNNGSKHRD
jgi:hypothetical protein